MSVFSTAAHLLNTLSLCSSPQDVTVQKRCHQVYLEKKKKRWFSLLSLLGFFFLASHSTAWCSLHLLVKGPIFTKHWSSCLKSSLTCNESASSKLCLKKKKTQSLCSASTQFVLFFLNRTNLLSNSAEESILDTDSFGKWDSRMLIQHWRKKSTEQLPSHLTVELRCPAA